MTGRYKPGWWKKKGGPMPALPMIGTWPDPRTKEPLPVIGIIVLTPTGPDFLRPAEHGVAPVLMKILAGVLADITLIAAREPVEKPLIAVPDLKSIPPNGA